MHRGECRLAVTTQTRLFSVSQGLAAVAVNDINREHQQLCYVLTLTSVYISLAWKLSLHTPYSNQPTGQCQQILIGCKRIIIQQNRGPLYIRNILSLHCQATSGDCFDINSSGPVHFDKEDGNNFRGKKLKDSVVLVLPLYQVLTRFIFLCALFSLQDIGDQYAQCPTILSSAVYCPHVLNVFKAHCPPSSYSVVFINFSLQKQI